MVLSPAAPPMRNFLLLVPPGELRGIDEGEVG